MASILVIRHSLALANEQGILMGAKFDSPLSDKGRLVARQKGERLRAEGFKPDKVYTSQLTRAKQTAEIITEQLGVHVTATALGALNERDFGAHDGKPYKSVLDAFEKYGQDPPTIETVTSFVSRVAGAWEQIKRETTGTTLVVTHSNPEMVMQTLTFNPADVMKFWELGDPAYCEGFVYEF